MSSVQRCPPVSTATEAPRSRGGRGQRRPYGTGSLKHVGGSWIGTSYARDGRQVRRKVGDVRTPGQQDGLTLTQAERKLASMRQNDPPRRRQAGDARVTTQEAGDELARTLVRKDRKKSHRLTVASDLRNHIVPFFELRHTFGTRMAAHGVPLRRLQEWMATPTPRHPDLRPLSASQNEAEVIDLAFA